MGLEPETPAAVGPAGQGRIGKGPGRFRSGTFGIWGRCKRAGREPALPPGFTQDPLDRVATDGRTHQALGHTDLQAGWASDTTSAAWFD